MYESWYETVLNMINLFILIYDNNTYYILENHQALDHKQLIIGEE